MAKHTWSSVNEQATQFASGTQASTGQRKRERCPGFPEKLFRPGSSQERSEVSSVSAKRLISAGNSRGMRAPWLVLILVEILRPLVLGDPVCHRNDTDLTVPGQRSLQILSRRRRLTFPKGSAFVMTVSTLQSIQLPLQSNWYLDFEFDVIWPIQTQENVRKKYFKKKPWMVKRRHRRELYANFETALNSRNLPGRQCVLRAICEAKTLLNPPGVSFIEDAIRLVLSNVEDVDRIDSYDIAYRTKASCDAAYSCPFSFLKLLLFNLYSSTGG